MIRNQTVPFVPREKSDYSILKSRYLVNCQVPVVENCEKTISGQTNLGGRFGSKSPKMSLIFAVFFDFFMQKIQKNCKKNKFEFLTFFGPKIALFGAKILFLIRFFRFFPLFCLNFGYKRMKSFFWLFFSHF